MDQWGTQISTDRLIRHRKSGKTFLTQYLANLKTVTMVLVIIILKKHMKNEGTLGRDSLEHAVIYADVI